MDLAAGFWDDNDQWIIAAATLAIAFLLAHLVDRAFRRRAHRVATTIARGGISREADTRLRFVRRLTYAAILAAGIVLALAQFEGAWRIAASVLASGVVLAAIVGFAARQTLANFVAGVMIAITQPIRIGDWISFGDDYGQVEDVRLNYTILRTAGERRVMIPNEKLAGGVLTNETLVVDDVVPEVEVWIPPGADVKQARELLGEESGGIVVVGEAAPWGVRLDVGGDPVPAPAKAEREADLRARCVTRLQAAGLMEGFPPVARS
jgi:small-conductance mechanosensitive channel